MKRTHSVSAAVGHFEGLSAESQQPDVTSQESKASKPPRTLRFSFTAKAISRTIFPLSSSETPVLARRNHREFEHQLSRNPPTFCDASLLRLVKPHILRGLPHALLQKRMQEAAFDYAPRHPESTVLYQVVAQELETFPAQTEGAGSSGSTFC